MICSTRVRRNDVLVMIYCLAQKGPGMCKIKNPFHKGFFSNSIIYFKPRLKAR